MADYSELFNYDAITGILTWKNNNGRGRSYAKAGSMAGSINDSGYIVIVIKRKMHRAHRIIYELFNGKIPEGMEIDHINGIRDDNRIENLRLATRQQNSANSKRQIRSKSGAKGVYKHSKDHKWVAQIMVNKKPIYLGLYVSVELAQIAYMNAATRYFGEFARIG